MNYYCSISEILDYWVHKFVYDIDRVSIFCLYLSLIVLSVDPSARYLFKTFSDYQKNQKKTWFFRIDSLTQGKITEKLPFLCKSSLVWLNPLFNVYCLYHIYEVWKPKPDIPATFGAIVGRLFEEKAYFP